MTDSLDEQISPSALLGSDPASIAMGVRYREDSTGTATFEQSIEPWQKGIRGRVGVSTLGVLIDSALGSAAFVASDATALEFVVSGLTVSMTAWTEDVTYATSTSRALHLETETDTAVSTSVIESEGRLLGVATCRSIGVRRPRTPEDDIIESSRFLDHPGRRNDQGRPLGHLGLSAVTRTGAGFLTGWSPADWMTNRLGTVQGGVILSSAAAVAEQVAEAVGPQADRFLIDLSLDILRSPAVTTSAGYSWTSTVIRSGRRLTVISSELNDSSGRIQARSTATIVSRDLQV